jgi:hypothetical protein
MSRNCSWDDVPGITTFSNDLLQDGVVQRQISDELLQSTIFVVQLAEFPGLILGIPPYQAFHRQMVVIATSWSHGKLLMAVPASRCPRMPRISCSVYRFPFVRLPG